MKKRIAALLLAMLMVLSMTTLSVFAQEPAQLVLSAQYIDGKAVVELSVENADGLTDGQLRIDYDANALALENAYASKACAAASVNTKTSAVVSMAWAGSKLTNEQTLLLTLVFSVTGNEEAVVSANAVSANASGNAVNVDGATVTVGKYNPFVDIDEHWAKEDILLAFHANLFNGISETEFGPDINITRAMFVTVLYRLDGAPEMDAVESAFADVDTNAYYADAVIWATQNGVTNGTSETTFSPWVSITRQEMLTMLYRYAQYKGEDVAAEADISSFTDADTISSWAADAIQWALTKELVTGYPDGTLQPNATATRAQTAAILCRYTGLS